MSRNGELYPYADPDVRAVISRLLHDAELLGFLARFDSPRLYGLAPAFIRYLTRRKLTRIIGNVETVRGFQLLVEQYVNRFIESSMTTFEYEGVDALPTDRGCVFVSNHRDIAGDSMLVNYALHVQGRDTVRIAVGDNLVQKPFATDVMRLNKSFFIKRSGETRREIYGALMESSSYINESIRDGHSIWIAQAGGRAKDGVDLTDAAVIKMLTMASPEPDFDTAIESLSIVPVSLSYEFDPCDMLKARELAAIDRTGEYRKRPGEDLESLALGLTGWKGRVRLVFGQPVSGDFGKPRVAAGALDREIVGNLRLFPVNLAAAALMALREPDGPFADLSLPDPDPEAVSALEARMAMMDDRDGAMWILRMYANPVLTRATLSLPIQ